MVEMNSTTVTDACRPFEGNSDFYGLGKSARRPFHKVCGVPVGIRLTSDPISLTSTAIGIRVGVYMQITASWISNTFRSEQAAENHDANSIFVFAILIALMKAEYDDSIRPIEAWLMLQTCVAFFLTVLSIAGIRLQLLNSDSTNGLLKGMQYVFHRNTTFGTAGDASYYAANGEKISLPNNGVSRRISTIAQVSRKLTTEMGSVSFRTITVIKHASLSWTGLVWRSWIAALLVAINAWFWFRLDSGRITQGCQPITFLFAPVSLRGRALTFFRVTAILAAVPLFVLAGLGIWLLVLVLRCLCSLLIRRLIYNHLNRTKPDTWNSISSSVRKLLPHFAPGVDRDGAYVFEELRSNLVGNYWLDNRNALPTLEDILQAYAFMSSDTTGPSGLEKEEEGGVKRSVTPCLPSYHTNLFSVAARLLCIAFHAFMVATILWFILSIELTIKWNGITGVYTLSSTGQLIPFVIGFMSFMNAIQQTLLVLIKFVRQRQYSEGTNAWLTQLCRNTRNGRTSILKSQ